MTPSSSVTGALEGAPHAINPPRVLVVDDEPRVTSFFSRLLIREGCVVNTTHDGPSALTSIADHPPDVVLLDVLKPGADGFEICRGVSQEPD